MKTNYTRILSTGMFVLALAGIGTAQTPAPAPPAPPVWSVGPIDFSGLVDGYYTENFNHPTPALNGLYNFNVFANQFNLSMVEFGLGHDPDPVGFHVDFGFGKAFDIIHGAALGCDPTQKGCVAIATGDATAADHLRQAYISWKPKGGKGFEMDFGQFVTSAGAEVIEAKDNFNYSRSLLFAWAIPYYHFGLKTSMPMGKYFTGGFQLVNGWNNIQDNNSGKTIGLTGNFAGKKASWFNNYYTGPENPGTNKGFRNLYDTTLLLTPTDKASFYLNFDWAKNNLPGKNAGDQTWKGFAGAAKFQLNNFFALSPRAEWFDDTDGGSTGLKQTLKEFTLTLEGKMAEGLLARLEYRGDWSDQPFFTKGATGASKHQNTVSLGLVAFFGPKR